MFQTTIKTQKPVLQWKSRLHQGATASTKLELTDRSEPTSPDCSLNRSQRQGRRGRGSQVTPKQLRHSGRGLCSLCFCQLLFFIFSPKDYCQFKKQVYICKTLLLLRLFNSHTLFVVDLLQQQESCILRFPNRQRGEKVQF